MASGCLTETERKQIAPDPKRKVPLLFTETAKILEALEKHQGGLKTLLYKSKVDKSALNALVCKIVKHRSMLDHVISEAELADKKSVNQFLLRVVVYEGLFNNKELNWKGNTVRSVRNHLKVLEYALSQYHENKAVKTVDEPSSVLPKIPRYARINTLKISKGSLIDVLKNDGYVKVHWECGISYERFMNLVKNLTTKEFLCDLHIENLLIFHPETKFLDHPLYKSGKLILQDKASCFPVVLLNPTPGSVVLDACAAPGMKTTHLAALMKNDGIIVARDQNIERIGVMKAILETTNVTCATVELGDFTGVDPYSMPYEKVKYILVDPSCSGSGIVKRSLWDENPTADSEERLAHLSTFQLKVLLTALSFPNVERVAYSTCSIHRRENDSVVKRALKRIGHKFKLLQLPSEWPYVGSEMTTATSSWYGTRCLRTVPERDLTNGFFVAVFQRKTFDEMNLARNVVKVPQNNSTSTEKPDDAGTKSVPSGKFKKFRNKWKAGKQDNTKDESSAKGEIKKRVSVQIKSTAKDASNAPSKKMKRKGGNGIKVKGCGTKTKVARKMRKVKVAPKKFFGELKEEEIGKI